MPCPVRTFLSQSERQITPPFFEIARKYNNTTQVSQAKSWKYAYNIFVICVNKLVLLIDIQLYQSLRIRLIALKMSLSVGTAIIAVMTRLMSGSMMFRPVKRMMIPEITTPTETRVSVAACR